MLRRFLNWLVHQINDYLRRYEVESGTQHYGELYKRDSDGKFDWRRKSKVGGVENVIATSGGQGYSRKIDAKEMFVEQFPNDALVDLTDDDDV